MNRFFALIQSNIQISKHFYEIVFTYPSEVPIPEPGQFITIRVSESTVPFLRRPFAFSGYNETDSTASIIYQKRGAATHILAGRSPDERLDCIGPLGNSFSVSDSVSRYIIIAGGIGLGPMIYTANYMKNLYKEVLFIFGARDRSSIPKRDTFSTLMPVICTDDGSEGFKGTTIDFLNTLDDVTLKDAILLGCGPALMLKGCHAFARKHAIQCEVSMEQVMACGVGACMGCVIKVRKETGYARVCSEGPVFNSEEVVWTCV